MRILCVFLLLLVPAFAIAQAKGKWVPDLTDKQFIPQEYKDELLEYDLGSLWTTQDNKFVLGYIGKNYQRIRVKILSVIRDRNDPYTYLVTGKTMVHGNICSFRGTIKLTSARVYNQPNLGSDGYKDKGIKNRGLLVGKYQFREDSTQHHSGIFEGTVTTLWYTDKEGKIRYDDIGSVSDSYANNQFEGMWTIYSRKLKQVCNWGDFRIPSSSNLDVGAHRFTPAHKYLRRGWKSYYNAVFKNDAKAQKEEAQAWWE